MGSTATRRLGPNSVSAPTSAAASVWEREAKSLGRIPMMLLGGAAGIAIVVMSGGAPEAEAAYVEADAATLESDPPPAAEDTPPDAAPLPAVRDGDALARPDLEPEGPPAPETSRPLHRRTKTRKPVPPPPAPLDTAARVASALESGHMRASGSTLLVFPTHAPSSWENANSACKRRHDAGLSHWHLATLAELQKLRASRALPSGTWWSATASEDGNQVATLAPTQERELSKTDGKALPLCVHARPS